MFQRFSAIVLEAASETVDLFQQLGMEEYDRRINAWRDRIAVEHGEHMVEAFLHEMRWYVVLSNRRPPVVLISLN